MELLNDVENGAYSLRISSTKAVSRSSPISLYFSFSETSSSVRGGEEKEFNGNILKWLVLDVQLSVRGISSEHGNTLVRILVAKASEQL